MSKAHNCFVTETESSLIDRPHSKDASVIYFKSSRHHEKKVQHRQSLSHIKQRSRVEVEGNTFDQEMGDHCYRCLRRNFSLPDIKTIAGTFSNFWNRKPLCKRYSLQRSQSVEWDPVNALFTATTEDDARELKRILTEFEVNVNFLSPAGVSLLHTAALVGNTEAIEVLLEFGAVVDFQDDNGRSALEIALTAGNFDCASLLINAGASMGNIVDGIKHY